MLLCSILSLPAHAKRHPVSAAWPDHDADAAAWLAKSVATHGAMPEHPIVLHDGMVLDGWHRLLAFRSAGVPEKDIPLSEYPGDDPPAYVASVHCAVRHLTGTERADAVLKSNVWRGAGKVGDGKTNEQMASEARVSVATVRKAKARIAPKRKRKPKQPDAPAPFRWSSQDTQHMGEIAKGLDAGNAPYMDPHFRFAEDATVQTDWARLRDEIRKHNQDTSAKVQAAKDAVIAKHRDEISAAENAAHAAAMPTFGELRARLTELLAQVGRQPDARKKK